VKILAGFSTREDSGVFSTRANKFLTPSLGGRRQAFVSVPVRTLGPFLRTSVPPSARGMCTGSSFSAREGSGVFSTSNVQKCADECGEAAEFQCP
jgi:hypothetical protein